jgi:hypothetical protein
MRASQMSNARNNYNALSGGGNVWVDIHIIDVVKWPWEK